MIDVSGLIGKRVVWKSIADETWYAGEVVGAYVPMEEGETHEPRLLVQDGRIVRTVRLHSEQLEFVVVPCLDDGDLARRSAESRNERDA